MEMISNEKILKIKEQIQQKEAQQSVNTGNSKFDVAAYLQNYQIAYRQSKMAQPQYTVLIIVFSTIPIQQMKRQ